MLLRLRLCLRLRLLLCLLLLLLLLLLLRLRLRLLLLCLWQGIDLELGGRLLRCLPLLELRLLALGLLALGLSRRRLVLRRVVLRLLVVLVGRLRVLVLVRTLLAERHLGKQDERTVRADPADRRAAWPHDGAVRPRRAELRAVGPE